MSRTASLFFDASRVTVIVLTLALAACARAPESVNSAATSTDTSTEVIREAAEQKAALLSLSVEELKLRSAKALREQRIYTPAGDNAMEYYLALRRASDRPDATAEIALMDLQPYAVIAAEQALLREDFAEAERLRGLIAAADPLAPSLLRIAEAIVSGRLAKTTRESEATEIPAESVAAFAIAKPIDTKPNNVASASLQAAAPVVSAPKPITPTPAMPLATLDAQPAAMPSSPPKPTAPAATNTRREVVAIRAPQPSYPSEERRFGTLAEVKATFTIQPDGSVGDIDIESVGARRVAFERNVRTTLKRWQFEPIGETRSVTRLFTFAP